VHLAIDATGRFLALANYATGGLVVFDQRRRLRSRR
jgi:hypothetical protein